MKLHKSFVAVLMAMVSMLGMAETATVDGLLWQYSVSEGKAAIEKLLTPGVENVVIPSEINGIKVVAIGDEAFKENEDVRFLHVSEGVLDIGKKAFQRCKNLLDAKFPNSLKRIGDFAFYDCPLRYVRLPSEFEFVGYDAFDSNNGYARYLVVEGSSLSGKGAQFNGVVEFLDHVPVDFQIADLDSRYISYPKKYADEWRTVVPPERFAGYVPESSCKVSVSSKMRENAPTIMDVKMTPISTRAEVKIRPVAFRNGINSFGNVIKVKTFVDGTGSVVQNPVKANQEGAFSWNVAADLTDKVAKLKMDVMCVEDEVIPLELVSIPASSEHVAMTISRNEISPMRIRDAVMWLLSSPTGDVRVDVKKDGDYNVRVSFRKGEELIYGGTVLCTSAMCDSRSVCDGARDLSFCSIIEVKKFVLKELGYTILEGDDLEYARKMTGLKLENGPYVKMK